MRPVKIIQHKICLSMILALIANVPGIEQINVPITDGDYINGMNYHEQLIFHVQQTLQQAATLVKKDLTKHKLVNWHDYSHTLTSVQSERGARMITIFTIDLKTIENFLVVAEALKKAYATVKSEVTDDVALTLEGVDDVF